jgi:peroxiredoxin
MIQIGEKLPQVTFKLMTDAGPKDVSTEALFEGKKVALFAVPGAFTPTCSAKHLPGYVSSYDALKAKGVSDIICLSVNDAFVMDAWGKSCHTADKVTMVADGNGTFTQAIGLEMDAQGHGLGIRSQRYAMLVDNGVVTKMFVEKPGVFEVSSAEHLLGQL